MPRHENPHFACPAPAGPPLASVMLGLSPLASLMAGLLLLGLLLLGGCAGAERASGHGGDHRADHGAGEAPKHAPKHALKHAPEPGGDAATWFFDFGAAEGWGQDRGGACAPPVDAGPPAACGADAHSGHDPGHDPGLGPVPEIIRDREMRLLRGLLPDGGM